MLKKTIKYEDFMENEREETFYFNMTERELIAFNAKYGDLEKEINKSVDNNDINGMLDIISNLILSSYGKMSEDGRKFEKTEEIVNDFKNSAAYDKLLMDLSSNEQDASNFIIGIMPKKFKNEVKKQVSEIK